MIYPEYVVEEIRAQNDIVGVIGGYVRLTRKGGNYFGLCPFHNESTPSFSVSPGKQFFHCFGCGVSGNVYHFIMRRENIDFPSAIKLLAERVNYSLPVGSDSSDSRKKILYEIHASAARFFYENLKGEALDYLNERGLSESARKKFGLGYAPNEWSALTNSLLKDFSKGDLLRSGLVAESKKNNNLYDRFRGRVMFPIINLAKKIVGFGGRTITGDEAKYLNSPETEIFDKGKNLYGLNFAKPYVRNGNLIICEGYMDAISLWQAGFKNSAAVLGTALTKNCAGVLRNLNLKSVTLLFDSDAAGKAAINRSIPILADAGLKIGVAILQGAKDPDEYIKKYGAQSFGAELAKAKDYIEYQLDCLKENRDLNNPRDKSEFIKEASAVLAPLSEVEKAVYSEEIYKLTGVNKEIIQKSAYTPEVEPKKTVFAGEAYRPAAKKLAPDASHKAQNFLIYILCVNPKAFQAAKELISPEEFSEPHAKIARKAFETLAANETVGAARLASFFYADEELALISDIFNFLEYAAPGEDLGKTLTESVKAVKRAALNRELLKEKNDDNAVNQILLRRKNLEKLNIRLSDG
jgi:DNA primase